MVKTVTETVAENIIELQRPLAQHYHDILGSAVRKSLSELNDEQLDNLRLRLNVYGSVWILASVQGSRKEDFYDINQKILVFKNQIFKDVREIKPYPISEHGLNVQIRISTLQKFLP